MRQLMMLAQVRRGLPLHTQHAIDNLLVHGGVTAALAFAKAQVA